MAKNNEKNLTFEKALKELESITEKLSKGNLPLGESVKLFEEGMKLRKLCIARLNQAGEKIKILMEQGEEFKEEDFEIKENE